MVLGARVSPVFVLERRPIATKSPATASVSGRVLDPLMDLEGVEASSARDRGS